MEARIEGEEGHSLYGKRSVEWDLNDWKWDGDQFLATQVNRDGSLKSSSSCSDERNVEIMEKKKKKKKERDVSVIAMEEDDNLRDGYDDARRLTLRLGGDNTEGNGAKFGGGIPNQAVCCQVENCSDDLSKVKDYHRRHKVCEMHSKATSAVVGGILQRFCQQCSRYGVKESTLVFLEG